ncbi:uncharacterized protein PHALS_15022 [Plasmopara halstedii]|uniref:Uncharacterized protein n=1 Tax=Plasmopara halstedii TaxID=4781 RepID=A0A0P1A969_PLAHL|nr:uncharacterized protein PHALS_15022 [Plasmopara halstedii]CEG37102.1 hypothetical protein PHALS_15022 [Plasmopara halstedii]|eukprot:XP_024573471.1 hypothetical protein PHALS_15022 [Plasmopara halstedii]
MNLLFLSIQKYDRAFPRWLTDLLSNRAYPAHRQPEITTSLTFFRQKASPIQLRVTLVKAACRIFFRMMGWLRQYL